MLKRQISERLEVSQIDIHGQLSSYERKSSVVNKDCQKYVQLAQLSRDVLTSLRQSYKRLTSSRLFELLRIISYDR